MTKHFDPSAPLKKRCSCGCSALRRPRPTRDTSSDFDHLLHEHAVFGRQYGEAQQRCTRLVLAQQAEIERLNAEIMALRAAVIVRDTALAYAREDHAQLEASIPGLPKHIILVHQIETLITRVQTLMRERLNWQSHSKPSAHAAQSVGVSNERDAQHDHAAGENFADLEASLVAADLVICQTGCLSQGAYWRVQNHCERTGKACVLTAEPDTLRIVRIHKPNAFTQCADVANMWTTRAGRTS